MMDFTGKPPIDTIARAVQRFTIPGCGCACTEAADSTHSAAHRGQILIMFALFLTGLLGAVGLSVDLGMAFSQRRTMQSSADAGAYAGAWAVLKAKAVQTEVNTIVNQNKMNLGAISSIQCEFINDAKQSLGGCGGAIPGGASGVRVTVTESHPTFFIRVVPGAPNNVTTSATASANIKLVKGPGGGPFLPCAQKAIRADNGQMMDIALIDSNFNYLGPNPAAYGGQIQYLRAAIRQAHRKQR